MASTTTVNGLTSANHCRADGIDSTGTKADEMKVSGKMIVKPMPLAASGEETDSPSRAKIHEKAKPKSSSRATPPRISRDVGVEREADDQARREQHEDRDAFVTRSATVRPASTDTRAVGSDRKRSMRPFVRSSARPSAVTNPPKAMFCARMPGIRKST